MAASSLGRRLLTHITLRLVVATVLLGAALVLELREPTDSTPNPFFVLIGAVYAVSLLLIGSVRHVDRWPWLLDVSFSTDVVMVSVFVALTGGVTSLFSSLYVLPIVAASTMQSRRGAVQVAALGSLLYAGVVLAQHMQASGYLDPLFGIVIDGDLPSASVTQYTVGLNVFGLFAVALLSGSLAERLRRADVQLVQASEEIADLQLFNQYVIDNLLSGLATADEQNRLLTFNRAGAHITGHQAAAVIGRAATDVLQLPANVAALLEEDLGRTRSKRLDVQYRRQDQSVITLGLSVARLPLPDRRLGYLYTFQDVTEIKRLEHDAQLQKRLAAVGEMAAAIAHEIRNPLASMSGSMQLLRQELALSSDQAHLMEIVLRESDRLNETIRSFLAYARPQRFEVRRLDLRQVVQETAAMLRNSHEVHETHTIDVRIGPDPVLVDADENQVRQIVWNLATNGLRAMPDGGSLTLSANLTGGTTTGAVLTVTDQGVGIRPDDLDHIFQPFRGSFGKGTGLGLAIVHRIATDHQARIDVESQPGQGTTFRVRFPSVADHPVTPSDRREAARLGDVPRQDADRVAS